VLSVAYSPDGAQILSGGHDGTVRVWVWDAPQRLLLQAVARISRPAPILTAAERRQFGVGTEVELPGQGRLKPLMDQAQALALVEQGKALARAGDLPAAVEDFREALQLDPKLRIKPEALAQRILDNQEQALRFANASLAADPNAAAKDWRDLCWLGATWNHASLVLDACETAVKLAPDDGDNRDSRGLARALSGDVQGAIEDFEFALAQAKANRWSPYQIATRTAWIKALRAGQNPFDAATLERLRPE
ncbi:MAG: tetratricopeptide repeat protein, partial [Anaerolineae bacterium]